MRVTIVRRVPGATFSLDVYADNLVAALKTVRPTWEIIEIAPIPWNSPDKLWLSGPGIKKYYETFWRHPRAVARLESDIFHVIDQCESHIVYSLLPTKQPVVVTCHDLVQFIYPEILKGLSRWPALSLATWKYSVSGIKKADRVISVSTNTAQDVTRMLEIDPAAITVVPNGITTEFRVLPAAEVAKIREQYTRSPDTFCLLNVGSTHLRKNISTILQVLKVLKDKGFPVCLWRTGDNFNKEQKAFIAEQDLESDIFDLGSPDRARLVQIYNAADVLLAPSLYEGFGMTVVEAMACGTPVITSNVSSLPEVVDDAAVLVDPLNVEEIVAAVLQIKQDSSYRHNLVEKGLARAKFFSWHKTAEQVARVYESVLQKSHE
ncbi:glycosyltransferase family 4 protein [Chamaesiphon polymorphus]|uniref:Glycosyl transferase group 1 n=1 Tax=Chamaesiphon polymorphus CCALA 037 TaxID=2107692 RepID=A0A2T1GN01_9CYAN|nr:glycosyltransferase family 1 protein [Chamaesiphon polymorphus]PSB59247.1 glycosyl transferase group 1 [Chamaesiphon polymorphus CCALA 037]